MRCGPGDPEEFLYLGARQPDGTRSGGGQSQKIQRLADEGGNVIDRHPLVTEPAGNAQPNRQQHNQPRFLHAEADDVVKHRAPHGRKARVW